MGRTKSYPVSKWAKLIYEEGQTIQQVADQYGVSPAVVRERLRKAGHKTMREWRREQPASEGLTNKQILEIRDKRMEGRTWKELGKEYGMDEKKILAAMRYQCLQRGWEWPISVPGDY